MFFNIAPKFALIALFSRILMSTFYAFAGTSVSPIFMAAGPGIKENFITDRIIREVDVAPTVALLGGVRMPAQCEGAPVYQILSKEM